MIAVIRVRGTVNIKPGIRTTLENLRLFTPNSMVVVPDSQKKMVEKIKDYTTYGSIDEATFAAVLEKRGMTESGKLSVEFLKAKKISGFAELAKKVLLGSLKLKDVGVSPMFRLHPPKKGWERKGIKVPFAIGGALGDRGEHMKEVLLRMI